MCPLPGVCSQTLICSLKVLPPGLKVSAQLHECMLLKNGDRLGESACFHVSSWFTQLSADCTSKLSHVLCRYQCPLGKSSPEALYCTWLYPFFLLPGSFLLSPSYTVSLLGQVQSLTDCLSLPIFQVWSQCLVGLPFKHLLN